MIRGVSRYSVEIKGTGSPYFERAICFVRPEFARGEQVDLRRAAHKMIDRLSEEVDEIGDENKTEREKPALFRLRTILPLVISGLTGAAAAFLICLLI